MDSYTEAESDLLLGSTSFLHRVNDRVRKRQYQSSKDATKDSDNHSVMWTMFMFRHNKHLYSWERITWKFYIPSKNTLKDLKIINNTGNNLTVKQMFDISEKLIAEQSYEIYGVNTTNWCDSSWKQLS